MLLSPEMVIVVVRSDMFTQKPTRSMSWEGSNPMCDMASAWGTTGVCEQGMNLKGQPRNLGEPNTSLRRKDGNRRSR